MSSNPSDDTAHPVETAELQAVVLESIAQLNRSRTPDEQLEVSPTAPIFGNASPLDSLGLVALLIEIEERLADRGMTITLANERAMSRARSPFRDVPTLLTYLEELAAQRP
jgi:acyl carrier protein